MTTVNSEEYLEKRRRAKLVPTSNHGPSPKIEKGIPIPVEARGGARHFSHSYPFEKMKVGDSFWVNSGTSCTNGAITDFAKRTGWKFVSRAQSHDGKPNIKAGKSARGTRVWRVA